MTPLAVPLETVISFQVEGMNEFDECLLPGYGYFGPTGKVSDVTNRVFCYGYLPIKRAW
jgi:hypothetical protein